MPTYTPPTQTEYFTPTGVDRLWSRVPYQRALTVLVTGDTVTQPLSIVDGDALVAADAVYAGGQSYTIDDETEALLVGAELESDLTDEGWPVWLLSQR